MPCKTDMTPKLTTVVSKLLLKVRSSLPPIAKFTGTQHAHLFTSVCSCFCAIMRELNSYNREHVAYKAQSMTTWVFTGFCLVSHHQNVRFLPGHLICRFWSLFPKDVLSGDLGDCMSFEAGFRKCWPCRTPPQQDHSLLVTAFITFSALAAVLQNVPVATGGNHKLVKSSGRL